VPGEEPECCLLVLRAIQSLDRGLNALKRLVDLDQLLDLSLGLCEFHFPFPAAFVAESCRMVRTY
jgi:hypothetical protein